MTSDAKASRWPALTYLLSAYFHQDFEEEYGGDWRAVDAFVKRDPATARLVPTEIADLLRDRTAESDVATFVDGTGCEYAASVEEGGYSGWLRDVARRINAAVWPALNHLMGAYLHQDFDIVGTVDDNVDLFVDDEPELGRSLASEISELLEDALSDHAAASLLYSMGCEVLPGPDDGTCREWLTSMADRSRARLMSRNLSEPGSRHPALRHLMGGYFHLDWFAEHEDEWLTLRDFVEGEPRLAPLLPGEIRDVLTRLPDDDEIRIYLLRLGSCYTVSPDTTYRDWLTQVAYQTEQYLARG